ncbi:hypothetical protein PENSTE_c013G08824 [Penicillium steckii]|uniref:Uncharacterized protein n=1 Tax=Penicillium steckii TaxID=303698 RepID=A0A1V6T1Y9_9EURO|nr:hypothetical protein PENSTE_c013G08824 [Penicillium steckii]
MPISEFLDPQLRGHPNPHPLSGYAHAPIPNRNPDWKPDLIQVVSESTLNAPEGSPVPFTTQNVTDTLQCRRPRYPMVKVNRINSRVCDIVVHRQIMCGICFETMAEYRNHLSAVHPGATISTGDDDALPEHWKNGTRALRKWVLSGGWRKADYDSEPFRGPVHSLLGEYCDFLEAHAQARQQIIRLAVRISLPSTFGLLVSKLADQKQSLPS